ncbi:MAG: Gfo/Idh/MocA family oxidoreductase [Clostridia bacterium]|nr:Gfo/Idh/MocA family oxidoreductase [Clostridia bacterium]
MKTMNVAVIGCGSFAQCFVPLFQAHPTVDKVFVCDLDDTKAKNYKEKFNTEIIPTFEEAIAREDVDAVAIFTERHTHAPLVLAALDAGKHVYSAVPMACTPEECKAIIDKVAGTGLTYMMGETCVYYPCSMYCKKEHEKGAFGDFVFGESQYFHDLSHFPKDYQESLASYSLPPFFYPTHSTAMILNATGAYATRVTAFGYKDKDARYLPENNPWGNPFSGEFSLMELSCGGVARVSEVRRIGYKSPSSYISGFYGTNGSYQFSNAQHLVTTLTKAGVDIRDVSDEVNPAEMTAHKADPDFKHNAANHVWQGDSFSPVQADEIARLPEEYKGLKTNGHMASHQFLIDDFCTAVQTGKLPYVNAWRAARYTIPGLMAHRSAMQGGIPLDIPDYGDPPER